MTDLGPSIVTVIGTIGGGVVGVFGTLRVTKSSNAAADQRTAQEMSHRETESARDRAHELTIDTMRAARATRERVYPLITAAAQEAATTLAGILAKVNEGEFDIPDWTLDTPERRVAWSEMAVFASESASLAWHRFMSAGGVAVASLESLRLMVRTLAMDSEEDMQAIVSARDVFAGATEEFVNVESEMLGIMRRDLSPDLSGIGSQSAD